MTQATEAFERHIERVLDEMWNDPNVAVIPREIWHNGELFGRFVPKFKPTGLDLLDGLLKRIDNV